MPKIQMLDRHHCIWHAVQRGSDINAKHTHGKDTIASGMWPGLFRGSQVACWKVADMNAKNDDDKTPLHLACIKGSSKFVKWLSKRGCGRSCERRSRQRCIWHAAKVIWMCSQVACAAMCWHQCQRYRGIDTIIFGIQLRVIWTSSSGLSRTALRLMPKTMMEWHHCIWHALWVTWS